MSSEFLLLVEDLSNILSKKPKTIALGRNVHNKLNVFIFWHDFNLIRVYSSDCERSRLPPQISKFYPKSASLDQEVKGWRFFTEECGCTANGSHHRFNRIRSGKPRSPLNTGSRLLILLLLLCRQSPHHNFACWVNLVIKITYRDKDNKIIKDKDILKDKDKR